MGMSFELIDAVARVAVSALLNGLWQGAAVAVLVGVLLRAMPEMDAATRYRIWSATLLAVLVLLVAAGRVPQDRPGGVPAAEGIWMQDARPYAPAFDSVVRGEGVRGGWTSGAALETEATPPPPMYRRA